MKSKRFWIWIYASVASGVIWGIWQGGIIQGMIFGGGVFVLSLAYEGYLSLRNKA